jgi:ankyrin repeat protein
MTKKLVEIGGCIVDNRDHYGSTAFQVAISHGMNEVAHYLYSKGVEPTSLVGSSRPYAVVRCTRPLLRGDIPVGRQYATAMSLRGGKRVVMFGGVGCLRAADRLVNNPMQHLNNQTIKYTWNSDIHCA